MKNRNSIGIFDSGVGGLNTLKILKEKLPNENFIYFADNINLPYGDKSKEDIVRFSTNIARFLIEWNVKAILIPCNTSSSNSLNEIKDIAKSIEVFDIISPIVYDISKNSGKKTIAVIATNGTVKSNIYLQKFQFYNSKIHIMQIPCPEFVSIIESNRIHETQTDEILLQYFDEILKNPEIQTLIYGCTHYQHLDKKIRKTFSDHQKIIEILNPDDFLCDKVMNFLQENNLLNNDESMGKIEFYVSGDKKQFLQSSNNFFNFIESNQVHELKNFHRN